MSKISHHKLAIAKGAQPFDLDSERPSLNRDTNGEDSEDIYTNLQQVGNYRDHFIELDNDKRTWDNSGVYQNQNRVNEVKCQNDSKKRRHVSASTSSASTNSNLSNLSSLHDSLFDSNVSTGGAANFSNADSSSIPSPPHAEPVAYEPIYAYVEEDPYGDESLYAALMEIRKKVDLPPNGELFRSLQRKCLIAPLPD